MYSLTKRIILWTLVLIILADEAATQGDAISIRQTTSNPLFDIYANIPEHCKLPFSQGTCEAAFRRWFFNYTSKQCERVLYGGCGRGLNHFDSERDCKSDCLPQPSTVSLTTTTALNKGNLIQTQGSNNNNNSENKREGNQQQDVLEIVLPITFVTCFAMVVVWLVVKRSQRKQAGTNREVLNYTHESSSSDPASEKVPVISVKEEDESLPPQLTSSEQTVTVLEDSKKRTYL